MYLYCAKTCSTVITLPLLTFSHSLPINRDNEESRWVPSVSLWCLNPAVVFKGLSGEPMIRSLIGLDYAFY